MTKSVFSGLQANMQTQKDMFFLGRGLDYAISLEGSLKMKEISYIHSEAYAAGELKHGTISLIEDNTLVVGVLTQSNLYEKTISNMVEVKTPWRISDGTDHIWQLWYRRYRRFLCLCTEDRSAFCNQSGNHSVTVTGILCQRSKRSGCR